MPSAALVFRATCGCFHPVYQAFMAKRAKEKAAVRGIITVLTPRCCRTDGGVPPTLGLLFVVLVWGGVLLRCGDVEQNPGPPKQDPVKQTTRWVTCGLEASLDRMGRTSGSGQSPPPPPLPPDPPTATLMDVMTQMVSLENSMNPSLGSDMKVPDPYQICGNQDGGGSGRVGVTTREGRQSGSQTSHMLADLGDCSGACADYPGGYRGPHDLLGDNASSSVVSGGTIRLLVVGKSGCGKSSTINTILGQKLCKTSLSFHSVTTQCETLTGFYRHKRIQIMDTPGLFDTHRTQEETCAIIVQALVGMHPGPHAVVFVLRAGVRFTQEEYDAYRSLKALFDETISRHIVLLFSHGDCLQQVTLKAMVQYQWNPRSFKTMVEECEDRYVLFNNNAPDDRTQVDTLLQHVASVMTANEGRPFSCAKYFQIGKSVDEEVDTRIKAFEKKDLQRQKYVQTLEQKARNAEVVHRKFKEKESQREREIAEWKVRIAEWEEDVRQRLVHQKHVIHELRQELERLRRELIPQQVRSMREFRVDILKEVDQLDNRDVSNLETARQRSERGREDDVDVVATNRLNTGEDSEFLQKVMNNVTRPDL